MGRNYEMMEKVKKLKVEKLKVKSGRFSLAGRLQFLFPLFYFLLSIHYSLLAIRYSLKSIRYSLIFLFILSFTELIAQQDPQFTQYMFNPVVINPAYTGSREVLSTALVYRNQWVSFKGAPITQTFSVHSPLRNQNTALGFYVMNDQIGPRKTTGYFGSYAYRLNLPNGKLSMGVRGGIYDFRYNWDMIEYKDNADVYNGLIPSRKVAPNFDFGLYYYTKTFYAGAAISHLGNPRLTKYSEGENSANLFNHFTFTSGKAFELNDNLTFRPSMIIRTAGSASANADLNLSLLFNQLVWVGVAARTQSGLMLLTEINITDKLRVGYSYDFTLNRLRNHNSGSHEIFIGYDFQLKRSPVLSPRYF